MSRHLRPGSLETVYSALFLGWGVVPLMLAVTLMQQPNPANIGTVLFTMFAVAWWACGLGMAAGLRWTAWPAMGVAFVAWAAVSVETFKATRLLLEGGEARLAWEDVGYRAVFLLLPLSVLLVLGWLTRPGRGRQAQPGPPVGRMP